MMMMTMMMMMMMMRSVGDDDKDAYGKQLQQWNKKIGSMVTSECRCNWVLQHVPARSTDLGQTTQGHKAGS